MNDRNKVRPTLPEEILKGIVTSEEDFQNKVLRPIIKMQSDLLIVHVQNKLLSNKIAFTSISAAKKETVLNSLFSNDQAFKREIIGMVIGHFGLDEYEIYIGFNKEINRRITQIVLNRVVDLLVVKK